MSKSSLTGVIDYSVGNVRSVFNAVKAIGGEPVLIGSSAELLLCDRLILPGVGAFAHGMGELQVRGLDKAIMKAAGQGVPIMGICLGMQMLTQKSYEFGETKGLGLTDGVVSLIEPSDPRLSLRLPHVAWKPIKRTGDAAGWLFDGIDPATKFYFIHSYAVSRDSAHVVATAEYDGVSVSALILFENVVGTQFHPEKSGPGGLRMLHNFVRKGL